MGQVYDYTTEPKNPTCPKCGLRGLRYESVDGIVRFRHKEHVDFVGGFGFIHPDAECTIYNNKSSRERNARNRYEQILLTEKRRQGKTIKAAAKAAFKEAHDLPWQTVYAEMKKRGYTWNAKLQNWQRQPRKAAK